MTRTTMKKNLSRRIAEELALREPQVQAVVALLEEEATVPFISRYRKEATGGLDEVSILSIRDMLERLKELEKRRDFILKTLEKQGVLTDEVSGNIHAAQDKETLEDLYLPFKPKRKTRAAAAREKGLLPLAEAVLQGRRGIEEFAESFVSEETGTASAEEALEGARDIIAEMAAEDGDVRSVLRGLFRSRAILSSRVVPGREEAGATYRDYFDYSEPVKGARPHRFLALQRGEAEGFLRLKARPDPEEAIGAARRTFIRHSSPGEHLLSAVDDGYERLLAPSLENEILGDMKRIAHAEAIRVFAENLRDILLESPLGRKRVLALDPGFRTGCKVVCLDAEGKLLHHTAVYPLEPHKRTEESARILGELLERYSIEAVAVGNGTGGREAETFLRGLAGEKGIPVVSVNESGASVYSASETAREEFPGLDVTVRGAISIGRRLQDPLSEIVKIDPESIGVGQYQHDIDRKALRQALDDTVLICVNSVGVNLNSAGRELLRYVSGLSEKTARCILERRNAEGPFRLRRDLLSVPGLGPKTFEQCAGFLRIPDGEEPLDAGAVHPERYELVRKMAADSGTSVRELLGSRDAAKCIDLKRYVDDSVGLPTLQDILLELEKPGRDPRDPFHSFAFAEGINNPADLKVGMILPGIVTNVASFGAFVDIGVHQDGLVHISEIADRFVRDPREVVKVRQRVSVRVLSVDSGRQRISLSLKSAP